ncbi:MAG: diacylglycerol kinase (ATP) [Polaribacter sp.]|jgi:diacylglycerol kinase (ATP)
MATLIKLFSLKAQKLSIEIDGVLHHREAFLAEVANTRYTGTSFKMVPAAELDDGLLDLIVLNKISRLKLLKVFNSIYDGTHINYPEVGCFQAKKIKIIEEKPNKLIPDGEI